MAAAHGKLELVNVTKRYGKVTAVDAVTLTIEDGKLVTLLGPSGCGKTTVLRLIAGLEAPTHGTIRLGERDVTGESPAERNVSLVFQSYALFPHLSVLENVAYGPTVQGAPREQARERAREVMKLLGLAELGDRLPAALSGGQQQRVALARALVLKPAVLLFDEPLSNLDARLRRRVRDEIRDLQRSLAMTAVYVTHDREEALAVSDEIIVMDRGRIAEIGAPEVLFNQPRTAFVADFLAEANILPGTIETVDGELASVQLGPISVRVPHRGHRAGPILVAVRPDAIVLDDRSSPSALAAEVLHASFVGRVVEHEVRTALGTLFVIAPPSETTARPGAGVYARLLPERLVLVR